MDENKKTNPLSGYGVTDEEFEFYEKLYKFERNSYWKGIFTIAILVFLVLVVILLIARVA